MSYTGLGAVLYADPVLPWNEPWDAPSLEDLERMRLYGYRYGPYEEGKRARVAMLGLGAYLGLDKAKDDPFVKSVAAHRADPTSQSALREYGQIAGSQGGAAACTAAGAPYAAPLCSWLGGTIGAWIGENLRFAKGADMEELVADTWNNDRGPKAQAARKRQIAARAALTHRDALISEMALRLRMVDRDTALAWADDMLSKAGAPIPSEWRPLPPGPYCEDEQISAARIAAAKKYCDNVRRLGLAPPADCATIWPAPGTYRKCSTRPDMWKVWTYLKDMCARGGPAGEENTIRRNLGIPCEPYYAPLGPAAPADAPVDWSSIGADQGAVARSSALADRVSALAGSMLAQATSTDRELQNQAAIREDVTASQRRIADATVRGKSASTLLNTTLFVFGAGAVAFALWKTR